LCLLTCSFCLLSRWSQAVVPTALLRASCPPPLRGRTSCVLICSRQISRPLSHLSGNQRQVTSSKWQCIASSYLVPGTCISKGAIIRELSVVSMQIKSNLRPGLLIIYSDFTGLHQRIREHGQRALTSARSMTPST
jgi:hypothetical protein